MRNISRCFSEVAGRRSYCCLINGLVVAPEDHAEKTTLLLGSITIKIALEELMILHLLEISLKCRLCFLKHCGTIFDDLRLNPDNYHLQ